MRRKGEGTGGRKIFQNTSRVVEDSDKAQQRGKKGKKLGIKRERIFEASSGSFKKDKIQLG